MDKIYPIVLGIENYITYKRTNPFMNTKNNVVMVERYL